MTESLLYPDVYVVQTYPYSIMPKVYGTKLTGLAIDKIVSYLSQIEKVSPRPKSYNNGPNFSMGELREF